MVCARTWSGIFFSSSLPGGSYGSLRLMMMMMMMMLLIRMTFIDNNTVDLGDNDDSTGDYADDDGNDDD